jgi:hypothetical protein
MAEQKERLSESYVEQMTENMWSFFNLSTIKKVLELAGCNHINIGKRSNINPIPKITDSMRNTIFFKGIKRGGHYSFVDNNGIEWGTYEMELISLDYDDGICHGAALTAALFSCGVPGIGELIPYPSTNKEQILNYINITRTYMIIIRNGWWDTAILENFYKEVHPNGIGGTMESAYAYALLNQFENELMQELNQY